MADLAHPLISTVNVYTFIFYDVVLEVDVLGLCAWEMAVEDVVERAKVKMKLVLKRMAFMTSGQVLVAAPVHSLSSAEKRLSPS